LISRAIISDGVRFDSFWTNRRRQSNAGPLKRVSLLEQSAEGRLLLETSALSPLEFVEREFEHPVVRAGLLFFNGLREVDLRLRGFGLRPRTRVGQRARCDGTGPAGGDVRNRSRASRGDEPRPDGQCSLCLPQLWMGDPNRTAGNEGVPLQ
jgi:hypothetical protein